MFSLFYFLDKQYLHYLHQLNHGLGGKFFVLMNGNNAGVPLYLFTVYLIFRYEKKNALHIIAFIGFMFFVSQQMTAGMIKNFFHIITPIPVVNFTGVMDNVGTYVSKMGFVSTKASNIFSLCTFLNFILGRRCKNFFFIFLWPLMVMISQCVLKIHTINDVCYGALMGLCLGVISFYIYKRRRIFFKRILRYFLAKKF